MKGGLLAGFLGLGVILTAPWAHAQTAPPASSAAFGDAPAATVTPPAPPAAEVAAPAAGQAPDPLPSQPAEPAAVAPATAPEAPVARVRSGPDKPYLVEADDGEAEPSSGLGPIIAGWAITAVGLVNLASIPLCSADFYPRDSSDLCIALSIGVGAVGLGVGVPLLAVGYSKRRTYQEWRQHHPVRSQLLNTQLALQGNSALLVYRASF